MIRLPGQTRPETPTRALAAIAMLLIASAAQAAAPTPAPDDFAWGMVLEAAPGAAQTGLRVSVPGEVYRGVAFDDLKDVAVTDADGRIVPFTVIHGQSTREVWRRLPVYPVAEAPRSSSRPVTVETDAATVTVHGEPRISSPALPPGAPSFIVDTKGHRNGVRLLKLEWSPVKDDQTTHIRVDASDDMTHWRTASDGVLARLSAAGSTDHDRGTPDSTTLVRDEIVMAPNYARYLRIVPLDTTGPDWRVTDARVLSTEQLTTAMRTLTRIPGRDGTFDTGGRYPVAAVELSGTARTGYVRVYSRHRSSVRWQHRGSIQLTGASDIPPRPLLAHRASDRHWKLESSLDVSAMTVTLRYRPHDLYVLPSGPPPHTLVFGNAALERRVDWTRSRLTREAGSRPLTSFVPTVAVAPPLPLGGPGRAQSPATDPATIGVWALLGLGTALVLLLVRAVGRDSSAGEDGAEPKDGTA